MMKKIILWVLALLTALTPLLQTVPAMAQESQYAWVLVNVIEHDSAEDWEAANQHEAYNYEFSCSEGTFSVKTTFIGKAEDWRNPPKKHGEAVRVTATFSKPPERIAPDEEVTLLVTVSATENSLSFYTFGGSASASFDSPDLAPGSMSRSAVRFQTGDGENQYEVGAKNNYQTIEGSLKAKAPRGREEGEQIAVRQRFYMGIAMGIYYIYEWRGTADKPTEKPPEPKESVQPTEKLPDPKESVQPTEKPEQSTTIKPTSITELPSIGMKYLPEDFPMIWGSSGIDISDIAGEVYIHVWDENGHDWYFADLEEDLPYNAIIETGRDSFVILSLPDMTTFVIPPNSMISVGGPQEQDSKLSILAGHVWTNVKQMIKDGSMDIEMSQAVAGIKGTTFILEEDGETSTIKVFEGEVTVTPHGGGEPAIVASGMQLSATQAGIGAAQPFDINAELANWDESVKEMTQQAMTEAGRPVTASDMEETKGGSSRLLMIVLWVVLLLAVVIVVVVVIMIQNRKKKEAVNPPYGYGQAAQHMPPQPGTGYQAAPDNQNKRFCQNCGNQVNGNSQFCPGCGKPLA